MLTLRNVQKHFRTRHGAVPVLHDVHVQVQAGECVAVQSASGCGKTTLLLIAGGLLRPDHGTVQCGPQDVYGLDRRARARWRGRTIGFVFQQFHLVPYLTVFENICLSGCVAAGAELDERARHLAGQFGLTARLQHRPDALRIGERQRTARDFVTRRWLKCPVETRADWEEMRRRQRRTHSQLEYASTK